jgi:hypothetical protein
VLPIAEKAAGAKMLRALDERRVGAVTGSSAKAAHAGATMWTDIDGLYADAADVLRAGRRLQEGGHNATGHRLETCCPMT